MNTGKTTISSRVKHKTTLDKQEKEYPLKQKKKRKKRKNKNINMRLSKYI